MLPAPLLAMGAAAAEPPRAAGLVSSVLNDTLEFYRWTWSIRGNATGHPAPGTGRPSPAAITAPGAPRPRGQRHRAQNGSVAKATAAGRAGRGGGTAPCCVGGTGGTPTQGVPPFPASQPCPRSLPRLPSVATAGGQPAGWGEPGPEPAGSGVWQMVEAGRAARGGGCGRQCGWGGLK